MIATVDLTTFPAVLFDLDGVLTPTAEVHMNAWGSVFRDLFEAEGVSPGYSDADYFTYLDGKQRYDGVASLLASRQLSKPWGTPQDEPSADTVCGIGNRKNVVFSRTLADEGISAYPGSILLLNTLAAANVPLAVVSSSKNAEDVLRAAGIRDRFAAVVDGVVAAREGLRSKPAPDVFEAGAKAMHVAPADAVAIEDATSGVASAAAAGYGLVIGVDRGAGADALRASGAHIVVRDLAELAAS